MRNGFAYGQYMTGSTLSQGHARYATTAKLVPEPSGMARNVAGGRTSPNEMETLLMRGKPRHRKNFLSLHS